MTEKPEKPQAWPEIDKLECKGCGRCVLSCPKKVLEIGEDLNARGYRHITYCGSGCIGCGNCFYVCPEPYVFKIHVPERRKKPSDQTKGGEE